MDINSIFFNAKANKNQNKKKKKIKQTERKKVKDQSGLTCTFFMYIYLEKNRRAVYGKWDRSLLMTFHPVRYKAHNMYRRYADIRTT